MLTSLDLLVIVFMAMAAMSLLALCLMFLIRNRIAKRIFFYSTVTMGLLAAMAGVLIGGSLFPVKTLVGLTTGSMGIAAVVLERVSKGRIKMFVIAQIIAAVALVVGFLNAVL